MTDFLRLGPRARVRVTKRHCPTFTVLITLAMFVRSDSQVPVFRPTVQENELFQT